MIIGTAGHIDHGKTTLVRALTGVDTDRLPEEKKRGISIELGYAFLDLPGVPGRIGFIDVPGHERLVHTMLAGATGIDAGLLLVAADDGVMPQTREHLAVLSLLGVTRGIVVLTKADRVDDDRLGAVRRETQALLQGSGLQGAPIIAVAATTGRGLDELKQAIATLAQNLPPRGNDGQAFRLAIDRVFTLDGAGVVATGTVHAGSVAVGDELALCPDVAAGRRLRVRSVHAQSRPVERARAGERTALALVGIDKAELSRGLWLVSPSVARPSTRLDVQLQVWPGEAKALRSGSTVHLHLGSASVLASVAVLDGPDREGTADALAPGHGGRVQLVPRSPIGAWHGDRVVLRDASASRTIAGGVVLDPQAPARYRRTPQRLAELDALALPTAGERLAALLATAPQGLDLAAFAAMQGLAGTAALQGGWPAGTLARQDGAGEHLLGPGQAEAMADAVRAALAAFHERHPDELGPETGRLRRLACPRLPLPLWQALLAGLQAGGELQVSGAFAQLPGHAATLTAVDQRLAQKMAPLLEAAGFDGAWARDLARDSGESEPLVRVTLSRLARRGELHQVVKDLFYPPSVMDRLMDLAQRSACGPTQELTAARYRDATGLGRKRAIQVLEYLDRLGLLRRVGDTHRLRADSPLHRPLMSQPAA